MSQLEEKREEYLEGTQKPEPVKEVEQEAPVDVEEGIEVPLDEDEEKLDEEIAKVEQEIAKNILKKIQKLTEEEDFNVREFVILFEGYSYFAD